ncbi:MAG: hypothetical protein WAX69_11015 [Victivallales bacterium]
MCIRYNWPELLDEMQDRLCMNQTEIAERMKASQQTISKIMNAHFNPGIKLKRDLLEFAMKEGIDVEKYRTDKTLRTLLGFIDTGEGRDLVESYLRMSVAGRKRLVRYAECLEK